MFDTFTPFQKLQKQNFSFQSKRYEIWMQGKLIQEGKTSSKILSSVIYEDGIQRMKISYNDSDLFNELNENNVFDEFITAADRLQLITIPSKTNSRNMGIMSFQMTIGTTRTVKNFDRNEPYCCNLFLQNREIVKITFSFSNPEKLVEFYNKDFTQGENPLKDLAGKLGF